MCLLSMQVLFEVSGYCGCIRKVLGNAIEEVADPGILTRPNLVLSSNRAEDSLVQHRNTVCDPKGTRHFMGDDDYCHMKGLLQEKNEFIQFRCNKGVQPCRRTM